MSTLDDAFAEWRQTESDIALRVLHALLYKRALKTIRQLLHQERPDLASDAASDAILKIKQFRGDSAFSTWAYRIAKNIALMEVRRAHYDHDQLEDGDAFPGHIILQPEVEEWRSLIPGVFTNGRLTPMERSLLEAMLLGQQPQEWAQVNGYHRQTGWRTWQSLKRKLGNLKR